jgi:plasmid stabilization system protein ParE
MKILWSPTAVSDLESIREYIARDYPWAARKIANQIKESVCRLSNFPYSAGQGVCRGLAN